MSGQMIQFSANGGTANGYLSKPATGSGPGVIVVQEFWGLNDHVKELADKLAGEGFVALAPDLYHGSMAKEPNEAFKMLMALNIEQVAQEMRGAAKALKANGATGARVGAIGFCMGGQLALYAGTVSEDVGVVVDFYGIHPNAKPDYSKLQGPVLILCGTKDEMSGPQVSGPIEEAIKGAGKQVEMVVYEGATHAFVREAEASAENKAAAQDGWSRMLRHLRANLS
ncbi:MAG: Dienelactone hydrolase family [Chloroflexi bacterium]|nr:Dienelactone hydrolase family [Chloroflexota bacterium]